MIDERLRDAERRWKETGAVDDEASYLLERVRAGRLSRERLELAAACGHRAAVVATGVPSRSPTTVSTLVEWAQPLRAASREAQALVAVPLARLALLSAAPRDEDADEERAVEEMEKWLRCPCAMHLEGARHEVQQLPYESILRGRRSAATGRCIMNAYHILIGMYKRGSIPLGDDDTLHIEDPFKVLLETVGASLDPELIWSYLSDQVPAYALA